VNFFEPFKNILSLSPIIQKFVIKLAGERIIDIALHIPSRFEERVFYDYIPLAEEGIFATYHLKVLYHLPKPVRSRKPHKVILGDVNGNKLEVFYFKGQPAYILKIFPLNSFVLISGKIEKDSSGIKMVHPDFVGSLTDKENWVGKKPIYPLVAGLSQSFIQKFIKKILNSLHPVKEWLSPSLLNQLSFPPFIQSIRVLHEKPENLSIQSAYRKRLCFDEFLSHQLALILSSRKSSIKTDLEKNLSSFSFINIPLIKKLLDHLPFSLTKGQESVLSDIFNDFESGFSMLRLLQGDVGSGKTIVALISALYHIQRGGQVAFLVPTEILAQQHFETITKLIGQDVRVTLLTGRHTKKQKEAIYYDLKTHVIDLLVGTHALIQEKLEFKNLTYCIIDEQHRFGVQQRMAISQKGRDIHLLSMTATPIPRSLTLAQYGDMDISLLKEKPKGRKAIITTLLSEKNILKLYERLNEQLRDDTQVYWVCPLIQESENLTLTAAQKRFEHMQAYFKEIPIGIMHGKMASHEKDTIMQDFKNGKIKLLVSTTVIEVGVDVPNASIMVIENAERFGLAQLHQLRGRVGRGSKESYCILVFSSFLTLSGKQRLEIMKSTDDGFVLSEMDLKMRGAGDITGIQQSGMPKFKLSDFDKATAEEQEILSDLLEKANAYAWELFLNLEYSNYLEDVKNNLLPIFNKEEAYAKSG
jgi:ATP-dependent DNA helicase RecG